MKRFADGCENTSQTLQFWLHLSLIKKQKAFEKIKEEMKKPLKLSRPIPQLSFILQMDASVKGMSVVLLQENSSKRTSVISYASAKFNPTEARYHCKEQECLAVIWAIKRYLPCLEDRHFILCTDSTALTWLRRMKDYKSYAGKNNELADALSGLRHPAHQLQENQIWIAHCPPQGKEQK